MNVLVVTKRCFKVVNIAMELHYGSLKVVKFMMEFHHKNSKEGEVRAEA